MDTTDPNGSVTRDEFPGLLAAVQRRFAAHAGGPLFVTAATGLWPLFLDTIAPELKQLYACNACRRFVERYGAMVAIDGAGRLTSVLWPDDAPADYARASAMMAKAVTSAAIEGVLLPPTRVLGTPTSPATAGGKVWTHLAVEVPRAHAHALHSACQVQAERKEDWRMLTRGLGEFPQALVEQAHALLTSGALYRSEKCIGVATWLLDLHQAVAAVKAPPQKDALVWKAAATAPAGFAHVRSSMIGTLLEDLAAGLDSAAIKRRFDDKMAPSQYMRAQVEPSAGNIAQAEKAIAALKATGALARRHARLAELTEFVWRPQPPATAGSGGVFGHLTPKQRASAGKVVVPQQTMTWDKFARTVDIRASLLWDNRNDLDLHVITPRGEHIYYGSKRSGCGGWLDVDMNVRGETTTPVENIRWARGAAPRGHYRIYVQNFRFHEPDQRPTPFKVEVEITGEIYHFNGVVSPGRQTGVASDVTVFEFDHEPGRTLPNPPRNAAPPAPGTQRWNVAAGTWAPVTGMSRTTLPHGSVARPIARPVATRRPDRAPPPAEGLDAVDEANAPATTSGA